jgi:ribosome-binding protein aMBF1 (putative translation factor)
MEEFKQKVRKLRQIRGWTQEDMARQIHVSLSTIQRWEQKGAKPILHARRRLERLFRKAGMDNESAIRATRNDVKE